MYIRRFLLPLLVLLPMALSADPWPNPFIPQRADPWIVQHEGRSYFIATVPAFDRLEMRAADSLEALPAAEPVTIWRAHESGPMAQPIWAPELHRWEGKWYIQFAAGETGKEGWSIRMYVLENSSSDPLAGEWVEKGRVGPTWDTFSLDATMFEHGGTSYLVWAQHKPGFDGNTQLFIAPLENPWTLAGEPVMLTEPRFEWETRGYKVNEGAAVIKRHGRVFITYSASATNHDYAMGLLWADEEADLLDPASWHKSPGPVFVSSPENSMYGPGHNGFTTDAEGNDVLVYHARNYLELRGSPLSDGNRHARLMRFGWTEDGFPDFGQPRPDTAGKVAARPLYRDPVHDGAADPVVIWNPDRARWWMFYTNRRANVEGADGVEWVHGTRIGIAESSDLGATWTYLGTAEIDVPAELGGEGATHWAPEVMTGPDGTHHMYLTVVPGVFDTWNHPRAIAHFTSEDLRHWKYESTLELASDRVIDACVIQLPGGTWRMWYNNERDDKSIYYADSLDLYSWTERGKVVGDRAGEGPKVFRWQDHFWMLTDVWEGLAVYRSEDARRWTRVEGGTLLQEPGAGPDDGAYGRHPDVVVNGERAFLFYFTHPGHAEPEAPDGYATRRSTLHLTELEKVGERLQTDRDAPVTLQLDPGLAPR